MRKEEIEIREKQQIKGGERERERERERCGGERKV